MTIISTVRDRHSSLSLGFKDRVLLQRHWSGSSDLLSEDRLLPRNPERRVIVVTDISDRGLPKRGLLRQSARGAGIEDDSGWAAGDRGSIAWSRHVTA